MIRKTLAVSATLLCLAQPAAGVDAVSAEAGWEDDVRMARVGAQWNWERRWFTGGRWQLGGYWELSAGAWRNDLDKTIVDLGLTPVFRFAPRDGGSPYVEAAIGFHLLSDTRISRDKRFGSAFQFGDHIGAGVRFGPESRYDLSLRLQHLSNAGIRKPNPGIDFLQLRFQVHL